MSEEKRDRIDWWSQRMIGHAIEKLIKAVTDDSIYTASNIGQAINQLTEVLNDLNPVSKFTDQEANLSSSLHTWLRKYEDSHLGSILYSYIKQDKSKLVWTTFVKDLLINYKNKKYLPHCLDELDLTKSDDINMRHLIWMWHESGSLANAIKNIKEWGDFKTEITE